MHQKVKTGAIRASILDFKPRLANRCSQKVKAGAIRASILNFKSRLSNRCSTTCHFGDFRAVIPVFKPRIGNHCSTTSHFGDFRAAILDFKPRIGNHCSKEGINGQKTCSTSSARVPSRVDDASRHRQFASTQFRQWRQKRVLMRPEAAFPYVTAAEGAQHPPKKPPRSKPCRSEKNRRYEKNSPPRSTHSRKDLPQAR